MAIHVKLSVVNEVGKEAVVAILGPGDFFGEGCLAGQDIRMGTATAITPTAILAIEKNEMMRVLHILLGHQSVRITEKHFSPWIRSRQEQLEADVQRAWAEDPVIASQMAGTKQVQFPKERVN